MSNIYLLDDGHVAWLQKEQREITERQAKRQEELALTLNLLNSLNADNDPDGIERFNLGSRGLSLTRAIDFDNEQLRRIEALLSANERARGKL